MTIFKLFRNFVPRSKDPEYEFGFSDPTLLHQKRFTKMKANLLICTKPDIETIIWKLATPVTPQKFLLQAATQDWDNIYSYHVLLLFIYAPRSYMKYHSWQCLHLSIYRCHLMCGRSLFLYPGLFLSKAPIGGSFSHSYVFT